MSYILEALKKAQAERQLSSAPTIHALPIQAAPAHAASDTRLPLWIALGAAMLLAAGAAVMWWRSTPPTPPAPVVQTVAVAPAPPVQPALVPAVPMPAPAPLPMAAAPQPAAVQARPVAANKPPAPLPRALPAPAAPPVVASKPAPVAEPAPVVASAEDSLPFARDLPEPLRRDLPQVVFGGYMYSRNPADRLLLIDKVLRHEGEEVAPGLILEKLLPKAAVMNFRGTRYRVGY